MAHNEYNRDPPAPDLYKLAKQKHFLHVRHNPHEHQHNDPLGLLL